LQKLQEPEIYLLSQSTWGWFYPHQLVQQFAGTGQFIHIDILMYHRLRSAYQHRIMYLMKSGMDKT
jgi:hypothetical protein